MCIRDRGDTFNPTDAVYMLTDAVYYVSNGKIYSYNSGLLYRAAKHDKEYYWSNPASAYTYVYVFDELSKKFYILKVLEERLVSIRLKEYMKVRKGLVIGQSNYMCILLNVIRGCLYN